MNNYKPYTLIGSRETPPDVLALMRRIVLALCVGGYTGRSGGAEGADKQLELGCADYAKFSGKVPDMEVYIPWTGFNELYDNDQGIIKPEDGDHWLHAMKIACEVHPAWERCSRGARALHTRNVYQTLGKTLDTPSLFNIFYAVPLKDDKYSVKGGTATAVNLAKKHKVKLMNMYDPVDRSRMEDFVKMVDGLGGNKWNEYKSKL